MLTPNIETVVPDMSAAMVLATVAGSHFEPNRDGTETAVVTLRAIDLYRGSAPSTGALFEIHGSRSANAERRIMDNANAWNSLAFHVNDELLLALRPTQNSRVFEPLAAAPATVGGQDLKEAVAIEALPAAQRLGRIRLALRTESLMLLDYSLAALRVSGVASREEGAQALAHAFEYTHSEDGRLALFAEMETRPWLDLPLGPDAANRAILTAMLKAIVREPAGDRRAEWLNHFAAALGSKLADDSSRDRALRLRFAAALLDPPKQKVLALFQAQLAAKPGDVRYQRLAEAWSH